MKALIVGYGSAGKRHARALSQIPKISEIHFVTKQELKEETVYKTLEDVSLNQYDYIIVASETSKHYEQLKFLVSNVSEKLIMCEKPIFSKRESLSLNGNQIFVGYQLRYHPFIKKLKELTKNQRIFSCLAYCGYYLPNWRSDRNIVDTYSAYKSKGGGVILDLSHELDYISYLFDDISKFHAYFSKISNLEIDSEDYMTMIGITNSGVYVTITLDYISLINLRLIIVHAEEFSAYIDLYNGELKYKDKKNEFTESVGRLDSDKLTKEMHEDILSSRKIACSFEEALKLMEFIDKIKALSK